MTRWWQKQLFSGLDPGRKRVSRNETLGNIHTRVPHIHRVAIFLHYKHQEQRIIKLSAIDTILDRNKQNPNSS